MAFLLPVNQATQRNNWPGSPLAVSLMADFDAVLVRSLATPQSPCASTTQTTDSAGVHAGDIADNTRNPATCSARPVASMRVMPNRVASHPPMRLAPIPAAS